MNSPSRDVITNTPSLTRRLLLNREKVVEEKLGRSRVFGCLCDSCPLGPDRNETEIVLRKLFEESSAAVEGASTGREGKRASVVEADHSDGGSGTTNPLDILGDELLNGLPSVSLNNLVVSEKCKTLECFYPGEEKCITGKERHRHRWGK